MGALGLWALRNWLPISLGALLLGAGVYIGVLRIDNAGLERDVAVAKQEFSDFKTNLAVESLKVERDAAKKSEQEARQMLDDFRIYGTKAEQVKETIRYVQSDKDCRNDPVVRSIVVGVRDILDAGDPGGDQGPTERRPPAEVRGAAAPRSGQGPQR